MSNAAIRAGLDFAREARGRSWEEVGQLAREARDQVFQGPDFRESVRAFLEKRAPRGPSLS